MAVSWIVLSSEGKIKQGRWTGRIGVGLNKNLEEVERVS